MLPDTLERDSARHRLRKIPAAFRKEYKDILHEVGSLIAEYSLIEQGDRVMVAVSGGKDSHALLHILLDLQAKAPIDFSVVAYTLDQKQPGFDASSLIAYYEEIGVEYVLGERDTYSIVTEKIPAGQTFCSLCSRLRRGILYDEAQRLKANKIALGHHANDALETLLMNLFYSGKLAAMPPRLISDDGRNVVIRPLLRVTEDALAALAEQLNFPILPCNLCNNQEGLQRARIKQLIAEEQKRNPNLLHSARGAMANVKPSHLWDLSLCTARDAE
ncbi:MAG TPA: tRNA 2-thiocytidine(32) synthetase TtcA [Turneriella sp.]|nr:tRNA 2-thiocytidine(32) synthetase TtcA [Turneriella sp.]HNL10970.1 tRNA 2-thiocytidine(32) synthetase TtcA [Turneriella sp.]